MFLGAIFIRRLLLVVRGEKLQESLIKESARSKEQSAEEEVSSHQEEDKDKAPKGKSSDMRKLMKKGEFHFARKEFDEAENYFINITSIDETNLDANLHLGLIYLEGENFSKAEFFFHKLINLKKDPLYYSNLALCLYKQGRLLEAAEAYENALALDNKRAARFASLAQVYRELNNDEKALFNFEQASKKAPRNLDYLWALTEYYQKLGRDEDVTRIARKVLELDPYNKDAKKLL